MRLSDAQGTTPWEGARTNVRSRTGGDDTFSPVREKVSKERTFVRAGLPPLKKIKWYSGQGGNRHSLLWRNYYTSDIRCGCAIIDLRLIAPLNRERSGGVVGVFLLAQMAAISRVGRGLAPAATSSFSPASQPAPRKPEGRRNPTSNAVVGGGILCHPTARRGHPIYL